jgi:WD40 repeat protein
MKLLANLVQTIYSLKYFRPFVSVNNQSRDLVMILLKTSLIIILASSLLACEPSKAMQQPLSRYQYSEQALVDAAITPDGTQALILSIDGILSLWDNQTNTLIKEWRDFDINENVYHAALSRNKQLVAVAGKTQISILNVTKGETFPSWQPRGFDKDATITVLKLGHSHKNVWIGMSDGSVISVDLENNKQSMFAHHRGPVADIKISDNQQHILSSSTDGSVVYWNASNGSRIKEREQDFRITSLSIHEPSHRVFVSDALKSQLVWDMQEQTIISQLSYIRGVRTFRESLFVDNGRKLITASSKQKITLWDVRSGEELNKWQVTAHSPASIVLAMANGHYGKLHTLNSDGILEVWDIK